MREMWSWERARAIRCWVLRTSVNHFLPVQVWMAWLNVVLSTRRMVLTLPSGVVS